MATYSKTIDVNIPTFGTASNRAGENIVKEISASIPGFGAAAERIGKNIVKENIENIPGFGSVLSDLTIPDFYDPQYVFLHDFDVGFIDYTAEAKEDAVNDVPLLPDPVGALDALYIGHTHNFPYAVMINVTTAGTGSYTLVIEYWADPGWASLSPIGEVPEDEYKVAEDSKVAWHRPSGAKKSTINSYEAYWVRFRINTGSITIQPLAGRVKVAFDVITPDVYLWSAHF